MQTLLPCEITSLMFVRVLKNEFYKFRNGRGIYSQGSAPLSPKDSYEHNRSFWDNVECVGRNDENALKLWSIAIIYTKMPTGIECTERSFNCLKLLHRAQRALLGRARASISVSIYNNHRMLQH